MKTLVLGNVLVDVMINVDYLPKTGDDLVCNKHVISMGGCAYNIATVLKNFGVEHSLISPVGKGIYASIIREELEKNNYQIHINDESKDNGYCLCLVEKDGERSFITVPGIEHEFKKEWVEPIDSSNYDNIYVSGYEMEGQTSIVITDWLGKQKNKNIFFGPGPRINFIEKDIMDKMLSLNPILHLNDDEALKFTNKDDVLDAAKEIYKRTNNAVFITLGKDGVLYYKDGKYSYINGEEAIVENTVGAGDCHIGAIISCFSKGYSFEESCIIANKAAATVVSSEGSRLDNKLFNGKEFIKNKDYEIQFY